MNEERIKEIFADEEFVKEFFSKETPEEAQAMLAEKDIDVSIEELVAIKNIIDKKLQAADGEDGEICDDDLENVAGGVLLTGTAFLLIGVAVPVIVVGTIVGGTYLGQSRRW